MMRMALSIDNHRSKSAYGVRFITLANRSPPHVEKNSPSHSRRDQTAAPNSRSTAAVLTSPPIRFLRIVPLTPAHRSSPAGENQQNEALLGMQEDVFRRADTSQQWHPKSQGWHCTSSTDEPISARKHGPLVDESFDTLAGCKAFLREALGKSGL
jgi:hypothetical protein